MHSKQGSFTKRAVLVGLIAGGSVLAASAYAVSAGRAADKPRCEAHQMQQDEAGWQGRRAAHLTALKEKLKLTAGQEAAWQTYSAATQPEPRRQGMDRKAMRESFEKLSTPERLDRMQAMSEMRRARMAKWVEATKAFYAQLSPEQRRVFDAEAMPGRRHGGHPPRP